MPPPAASSQRPVSACWGAWPPWASERNARGGARGCITRMACAPTTDNPPQGRPPCWTGLRPASGLRRHDPSTSAPCCGARAAPTGSRKRNSPHLPAHRTPARAPCRSPQCPRPAGGSWRTERPNKAREAEATRSGGARGPGAALAVVMTNSNGEAARCGARGLRGRARDTFREPGERAGVDHGRMRVPTIQAACTSQPLTAVASHGVAPGSRLPAASGSPAGARRQHRRGRWSFWSLCPAIQVRARPPGAIWHQVFVPRAPRRAAQAPGRRQDTRVLRQTLGVHGGHGVPGDPTGPGRGAAMHP